jgi:hypothetical protein
MSGAPASAPCAYIATTADHQAEVMGGVAAALIGGGVFLERSATVDYTQTVEDVRGALADSRAVTGMTVPPPAIKIVVAMSTYAVPGPTGHAAVCQWLNGLPDDIWCLLIVMDNAAAWPTSGQNLQAKLAAIYGAITNERILPHLSIAARLPATVMDGVMTILTVCPSIHV